MSKGLRYFVSFFFVGLILLGTLCGFALVDLSAETYMPERPGSLLQVGPIDSEGMALSVLGRDLSIPASALEEPLSALYRFRGLLPADLLLVRELTLTLTEEAESLLSRPRDG